MKKIFIFPIIFFLSLLVLPTVLSWGPNTHAKICLDLLNDNSTQIGQQCAYTLENREAFLLGCTAPDLSVTFYYTNGGLEYRISHNFNFADELMSQAQSEDEQCLVYGADTHLVSDSVSHTESVPEAIKNYHLPNLWIHPLLEKKYDSAMVLRYPELKDETSHMMDALDGPKANRYIQMIDDALGENSQINVKEELTNLRIAISGNNFYNTQFNPSVSGSSWIFQSYYYIDKLTNFLAPYIGTVNFGGIDYYFAKSEELTISTLNNFGSRYQISPHGFAELSAANQGTSNTLTIILIASLCIPIALAYIKRNKMWLLLIPVLLIGVVVGVYALL